MLLKPLHYEVKKTQNIALDNLYNTSWLFVRLLQQLNPVEMASYSHMEEQWGIHSI